MRSANPVRDSAAHRRRPRLRTAFALAGAALACGGCGELQTNTPALSAARPLTVALNGQPSALYAPLYEGVADGAFARGALHVSVAPAGSDAGSLAALVAGRAQVAVASEPAVLAARASGERIVAVGALEDGSLDAIISLRPLPTARSLLGKTVATDGSALARAELAGYAAQAGVAPSQLRIVQGGAQDLVKHRAYAMVGRWDLDGVSLALAHRRPNVIRDLGVPSYTQAAIVVRVGEARYSGPLLRAFLQSLTRAETATRADPSAAAQALVRANPTLGMKVELAALAATQAVAGPPKASEPYGYQNPLGWQAFGNWMQARGLLMSSAVAGDTITDEFLPGQGE